MFSVHPRDAAPLWHGATHWAQLSDGAWWPRRVSPELAATAHNPHFDHQSRIPAGVHARFVTDATSLEIRGRIPELTDLAGEESGQAELARAAGVSPPQPATATLTVIAGGSPLPPLVAHHFGQSAHARWVLDPGVKVVEVWLPHGQVWALESIALGGVTLLEAAPVRDTWVAYGSSITQCAASQEPWQTWPALVSRERELELYGLGMGGQCHLDDAVERTIAQVQPRYVSLCLGINIYGRGSFDERSLGSAIHGFVRRIKLAVPGAKIAVITPLFAGWRENEPNHVGLTVNDIRQIVAYVGGSLADERLRVIDGLTVLGASDTELLAQDLLHPTHEGYAEIARRISPKLADAWQLPSASMPC